MFNGISIACPAPFGEFKAIHTPGADLGLMDEWLSAFERGCQFSLGESGGFSDLPQEEADGLVAGKMLRFSHLGQYLSNPA